MHRIYPENESLLNDSIDIKNYIYGGRGAVRLEAPSGKSHTYLFLRPLNPCVFPDDVLFVYALHDQAKEFYVGMIEQRKFRLTRNSRFLPDTDIVKGASYIMRRAINQTTRYEMKLYHQGICAVCGRKLTSTKSIATGIGPKCRKKELYNVETR